ncbi:hypothetical protein ACIBCN_13935 [Nocardia sp. NPDC051052]|uniref:hypothetical protein n=1 Tax=Nocardia sp. NPDC051052 TaxID=3364322 RepID=UPI003799E5DF
MSSPAFGTDHVQAMRPKISLLRELGAVDMLERRRENRRLAERYPYRRLSLGPGTALPDEYPPGLRARYETCDHPTFGDLSFHPSNDFRVREPIDTFGEIAGAGDFIEIGQVGEEFILLDLDTGAVSIYDYLYFRHNMDSGFVVSCETVPEFVDTVALGPRYPDIHGPRKTWRTRWWRTDPWYVYLREVGMVPPPRLRR